MVANWPSNNLTVDSVIDKKEMKKILSDNTINRDEAQKIIKFIENSITPLPDSLKSIVAKLKDTKTESLNLEESTKKELLGLANNVEIIKWDFNMETLAEHSNSKFFNIILKREKFWKKVGLEWYRFIIWEIFSETLWENKQLLLANNDTLNLIYWKKITDEIWIKSAVWMGTDKITWFFWGLVWKVSKIWKDNESGEMDISKMWDVIKSISKLTGWDEELDSKWAKKLYWALIELKWYINYMTKDYTANLNTLIELWKDEDKVWLQKLLDNPVALDEVLKTWKYNKDWYNIDLENKKVSFNANPNLEKSKTDFMKIAVDATNWNWGKLDAIKNKVKEFAWALKNFWLDADELRSFRDWLKDIPLIWDFLFALASFFLWDNLLNLMEWNPWEKEYMTSGKNLKEYIKDNKEKLPFTPWDEDFEDTVVAWEVESFLWKVENANEENFNNIEANKKSIDPSYKKWTKVSLIDNKDFWKNILSDTEPTDPILKQLWTKANTIKENDKNLSTEDFFKAMNKDLKIGVKDKIIKPSSQQVALDKLNSTILLPTDKASLITGIEKITILPEDIKIIDSAWLEKVLKLDFKDSKLSLNGKEFVLKDWDISDITIDPTSKEVILKIKDATWTTERTENLSKKQFAEMIAWLALWTMAFDWGFNFTTPKEKAITVEDAKNDADEKKIYDNKKTLQDEKLKLEWPDWKGWKIKKLKDSITIDSKLNKEIWSLLLNVEISKKDIIDNKWKINKFKKEKNDNLVEIRSLQSKDKENREWFWLKQIVDFWPGDDNKRITTIKNLRSRNTLIDEKIISLNLISPTLDTKLKTNKTKYSLKIWELKKEEIELKKSTDRIVEIERQLWATDDEAAILKARIEVQNTQREEDRIAEETRIANEKIEREGLVKAAVEAKEKNKKMASENKVFVELLKEPKEKNATKLLLSDWTEIIFDKKDNTLNFWWKKFGVENLEEKWKEVLEAFSFNMIYLFPRYKNDFIKVLSELKTDWRATLTIGEGDDKKEINFKKV